MCKSCEKDRLTLADAYAGVNDEIELCRSCTTLAWWLISSDLDSEVRS